MSYAEGNRRHWDRLADRYQRAHGATLDRPEPAWGAWGIPEDELRVLGPVAGRDVVELGCGAAAWSVHLARRGARVTGVDLSSAQLGYARATVARARVAVALVQADVAHLPFPDASFDLAFGDHGALTFAPPAVSLPEVARILRPGGRLRFNMTTPWLEVCWDDRAGRAGTRLTRDYFGLNMFSDGEETSFQLPYGEWIRQLVGAGFVVEDLVELRPPATAKTSFTRFASLDWARRWPAEAIWCARRA